MSLNEGKSYFQSPLFHDAMELFRVGKWDEGFTKFNEVVKNYPMETELRSLRQEMIVRSRIDGYEIEENNRRNIRKMSKYGFRIVSLLVILALGFLAISTYSGWIQGRIVKAQTDLSQSMLQAELMIEFRNAQQLFAAGKSDEALSKYEYIKGKNPEFAGLTEAIDRAQELKDVETQYTQAMDLLQIGDSTQALSILQDISRVMPNFRDVSLQIRNLQTQTELTSIMKQADQAYYEGRYEDALSGYESLRLMDPTYQVKHVEDNLFYSYIKAAEQLLGEPVPSMGVLRKIDGYFSKALALRPLDRDALAARTQVRLVIEDGLVGDYISQAEAMLAASPDSLDAQRSAEQLFAMALAVKPGDPDVQFRYSLAKAYSQAVNDFLRSDWGSVIKQLEFVVEQQAGYANGTAIQILYDAYIARGSNYILAGEYVSALEDFQHSAILAQQLPEAETLAFEAQIMIAEAQGLMNQFEDAVLIYQDALFSIGLHERISALNNSLSDSLVYAEYLASVGNYQYAYYAYSKLVQNRVDAYDQSTVITVKNGDYVSMIARRYNTTVAAILSANQMNNQPRLTPDTQLIIPILP